MKRVGLCILGILLLMGSYVKGQSIVADIFTDHMVLQQQSEVPVWGWIGPNRPVKVVGSWLPNDTVSVRSDPMGKWKATLKTINAGGPYTLTVISDKKLVINDVMLGEVWLCSGQSNMAWSPNEGLLNKQEEIAGATDVDIRYLSFPLRASEFPQQYCPVSWKQCSPTTMASNSAVAYFFARKFREVKKNTPIGLIVSAWGGTPAETWIPGALVENNPVLRANKMTETHPFRPIEPGVTYNQMIYPIIPYRIAGTIWYQGEANVNFSRSYALLMKTLIDSWRVDFGKDIPFYLVQIAPYLYQESPGNGPALLREQQEFVSKLVPHTGMVVISDLVPDVSNIHPIRKREVGERLANMILAESYGENISDYKSPTYKSMEVKGNKVLISFFDANNGIICKGKNVESLFIAGEDGQWVPAEGKVKDNQLVVFSSKVNKPMQVRYCFDNASCGNLFSNNGLPVAPFRTDRKVTFLQ